MTNTNQREIFGHPIGLYVLFFTEMWERFSFYGMKAILLFYLTKYHLFNDEESLLIKGSYASLVYAVPLIGGYLADNFLGFRKAIIYGCILLVLGHIGMAYEGVQAYVNDSGVLVQDKSAIQVFYFSLALIVCGVGFMKSNISSIVGELYSKDDPRRDSGFTIFHMGINLGALLATTVVAYLGEKVGWSYGFGAAGIGMILGLICFILGRKYLDNKGETNFPEKLNQKFFGIKTEYLIYIGGFLLTFIIWQMVQSSEIVKYFLIITSSISVIYIVHYAFTKLEKIQRERLFSLVIIMFCGIVFWSLFEQSFTSMNFFASRVVDRTIFGAEIAAGSILGLNSFFIIIFGLLISGLWLFLAKKGKNPNLFVKTGIGVILAGLGFYFMVLGKNIAGVEKIGLIWMVLAYLAHTLGELCIYPIGLSAVTKLAPPKILGFMMGFYFLSMSSAEFIAAQLATLAVVETVNGEVVNIESAKTIYSNFFNELFIIGLVIGILILILSPFLNKLLHSKES